MMIIWFGLFGWFGRLQHCCPTSCPSFRDRSLQQGPQLFSDKEACDCGVVSSAWGSIDMVAFGVRLEGGRRVTSNAIDLVQWLAGTTGGSPHEGLLRGDAVLVKIRDQAESGMGGCLSLTGSGPDQELCST